MRTKARKNLRYRALDKGNNVEDREIPDMGRSIAKGYIDARLNSHIHIRFSTEEYCAIFDRGSQVDSFNSTAECTRHTQFFPKRASGDQQVSMFIRVTQDLEVPEIPPVVICPPTVTRLKRIDNGDYCVGHPPELTSLVTFIFGDTVEDGELISCGGLIPFRQDELPNKIVKGASEVVKHLPDEKVETIRHGRYFSEAIDAISRCAIDIFGNNIRVDIAEGRQLSVQCFEVLCGSIKFSERTIDGSHIITL